MVLTSSSSRRKSIWIGAPITQPRPLRPFPLRLSKLLREQAETQARKDGVSFNHFISLAVAEKISRLEIEAILRPE